MESVWVEIRFPKVKPLLLSCTYRPPSALVDWYTEFENQLQKSSSSCLDNIIVGDFNLDMLRTCPDQWTGILNSFNLSQIIDIPTRITGNSSTLLDHVYVNSIHKVKEIFVSDKALSDHKPIGIV